MKASELRAWIEKDFPVGQETFGQYAVTGEPYVTLDGGGIKAEGEPPSRRAYSEEEAVQQFCEAFNEYVSAGPLGTRYVVYWRRYPELVQDGSHFWVRARLLMSDKPPLPAMSLCR